MLTQVPPFSQEELEQGLISKCKDRKKVEVHKFQDELNSCYTSKGKKLVCTEQEKLVQGLSGTQTAS